MSRTKRPSLKVNAASNWVPLVVNTVLGFVLMPYLMGHLGMSRYGTWVIVTSFVGYYGVLRMGIGGGMMRYLPFYRGSGDQHAISQIASTAMAIFLAVGLAILLVSILLAGPIARFYKGGPELASLVRVMGVATALECPRRILETCIRAYEHWVAANSLAVATAVTRALGFAGCVYLGYGVVEMGYVLVAVALLSLVCVGFLFVRYCPGVRLHPSMVKPWPVQALISFGALTTVVNLAYTLTLQGHSLIIGKVMSLGAVSVYAVPVLMIRNVREGLLAPARVLWPRFAYLDGKNHSDKVASLFLRGTRLTAIFACGVMFMIFVLGPSFIALWMDGDFTAAYPVLLLLAGGYLVEGSQAITQFLLAGTGRQHIQAVFAVSEGIAGFGLSCILTWRLGLPGAALGFVIAIVLMRGIVCPLYICRILNVSVIRYYGHFLMRPLIIAIVLTFAAYSIDLAKYVCGWASFCLLLVVVGFLYSVCIFCFALEIDVKKKVLAYLRNEGPLDGK